MTDQPDLPDELDERLAMAAAGDLSPGELADVEAVAARDPEAARRLAKYRAIVDAAGDVVRASGPLPPGQAEEFVARALAAQAAESDARSRAVARLSVPVFAAPDDESPTPPVAKIHGGRVLRMGPFRIAAAAAVVAAVAGVVWWSGRDSGGGEAMLVASARDLAARHPDEFGAFRPLDVSELAAVPPGTTRAAGEFAALAPVGATADLRPDLRWEDAPGTSSWSIEIAADGVPGRPVEVTPVRDATTGDLVVAWSVLGAPDLVPGRETAWVLRGRGTLGPEVRRTTVRAMEEPAARAYREALAIIAREAGPVAPLLQAHFALRLPEPPLGDALRFAREAAALASPAAPDFGALTLRHVLARLGSSRAGPDGSAPR